MSILNPVATGIFFDEDSVSKYLKAVDNLNFIRLESEQKVIFSMINSRPELGADLHEEWLGRDVKVRVIGYGRDALYEAFRVQFYPTEDHIFDEYLRRVKLPVILISKSNKKVRGASVSSLKFWPLLEPFFLTGKYGVLTKNGDVSIGVKGNG